MDPSLVKWTCDFGEIRITPDGQPSVFDMIRVLGAKKDPRKTWERLIETHPEVALKCHNLKFPGPGQRDTPVAKTREDAYYILGLLPGTAGRKYREQAAKLFSAYLNDPAKLAAALIGRMTDEEKEWQEARLKSIRTRNTFTEVLRDHGVAEYGFGNCTNAVYVPMLNNTARQLKVRIAAEKDLPVKKVNPRDHLSLKELTDVETAERVAAGQLKRSGTAGNVGVERVVRVSAEYTRKLLDGDISIPGLA